MAAEFAFSGDTVKSPGGFAGILSGSEGVWTYTLYVGGAGVVTAGTQRITLASDDPAVVSLQTLDNAISGSEMQVDVVGALPAGTNAIGKLAANSGVDIGDVDVTSVTPGTAASSLGKAEDAAHTSGDVGVMAMSVRQDTAAALSGTDGDYQPLITDGSGRLHVNVGNTVTVGSHAVTNAGTFAVQVDGAALTSLQLIDDSIGTIGAAAPTKAQAWGVLSGSNMEMPYAVDAATLQSDVFTFTSTYHMANADFGFVWNGTGWVRLRGSTSGVQVIGAAAHDAAAAGNPVLAGAQFDDTLPDSVDEGDVGQLRISANRNLYVTLRDAAGNERGLNVDGSGNVTVNVTGTVTVGSHAVTNAGTFAVQVDGAALTALQLIDNPVLVDDAAFTPATSSVMMAGFEADETATDSVDEGDAGAARMTLDRKVITSPQPHTAGGLSIFRSLDLDETEEDVKTSAGQVYAAWVTNFATTTRYLKFYNDTAANVVVGTTTPLITIAVPGNSSDDISAVLSGGGYGIAFSVAICVAVTTGLADNDTGAPAANDFLANIFYK